MMERGGLRNTNVGIETTATTFPPKYVIQSSDINPQFLFKMSISTFVDVVYCMYIDIKHVIAGMFVPGPLLSQARPRASICGRRVHPVEQDSGTALSWVGQRGGMGNEPAVQNPRIYFNKLRKEKVIE